MRKPAMIPLRAIGTAAGVVIVLACGAKPAPDADASSPSAAVTRFVAAAEGTPDAGAAKLAVKPAGRIVFPDGRLGVSDAFINDAPVIASRLPAGESTVELLVATSRTDERVAAARVLVGSDPVASWRRIGAIPIDSGTGAFFDPQMFSAHTPADVERFNDQLLALLNPPKMQPYASAVMTWQKRTMIAFSTGFGDGTYPVFVGSSSAGQPVVVVVDCEVLPWQE